MFCLSYECGPFGCVQQRLPRQVKWDISILGHIDDALLFTETGPLKGTGGRMTSRARENFERMVRAEARLRSSGSA